MPSDYLADRADDLLAAARAGLAEARTGKAPPSRYYVSHCPPEDYNCCDEVGGLLTVHLDPDAALQVRDVASQAQFPVANNQCQLTLHARFIVQIIRCVPGLSPTGKVPPADKLGDAARDLLTDLWSLQTHLLNERAEGVLFDAECGAVVFGDVEAVCEDSCVGWRIPIELLTSDKGPGSGS